MNFIWDWADYESDGQPWNNSSSSFLADAVLGGSRSSFRSRKTISQGHSGQWNGYLYLTALLNLCYRIIFTCFLCTSTNTGEWRNKSCLLVGFRFIKWIGAVSTCPEVLGSSIIPSPCIASRRVYILPPHPPPCIPLLHVNSHLYQIPHRSV